MFKNGNNDVFHEEYKCVKSECVRCCMFLTQSHSLDSLDCSYDDRSGKEKFHSSNHPNALQDICIPDAFISRDERP